MEPITCPRCGSQDDYSTTPSGPHLKATCNQCGRYIKFLPQDNGPAMLHFGKYAGMPIPDITDLNYLEWALANVNRLSARIQEAMKTRITALKNQ